jgi:hypothetical protein
VRRLGFESSIATSSNQRYVAVRALDSAGHRLGTSSPISR